jgi:hypothetical protein
MNPAEILDDCLQRLQAGEALASCLARYPDQATGLRPMLAAAVRVQGLAGVRLSNGQRLRARVTLRETLAQRTAPRPWFAWLTDAGRQHGFAMAAVLVVILFLALAVNGVAASLPGQPAYPLRVAIERAPVILQTTPSGRAAVELNVAERRLEDLYHHPASAGQPDDAALAALLRGDEAAAAQVHNLAEAAQREPVASRIAAHAAQLTQLAEVAPTQSAADVLDAAAERTYAIAERLRRGLPPGEPDARPTPQRSEAQPTQPGHTPTPTATPTATPTPTPTATASVLPVAPPPADDLPQPAETPEPEHTPAPGWRATAIIETVTAHPTLIRREATRTPRPTEPPPGPRPTGTHTPGARRTAIAETVTALPPLPPAIATRLPRTPEPTRANRPNLPGISPVAPTPEANAGAGSTATPAPASSPEPALTPDGRRLPRLRP